MQISNKYRPTNQKERFSSKNLYDIFEADCRTTLAAIVESAFSRNQRKHCLHQIHSFIFAVLVTNKKESPARQSRRGQGGAMHAHIVRGPYIFF